MDSSSSCPNSMFECDGVLAATAPLIIISKLEAMDGVAGAGVVLRVGMGVKMAGVGAGVDVCAGVDI